MYLWYKCWCILPTAIVPVHFKVIAAEPVYSRSVFLQKLNFPIFAKPINNAGTDKERHRIQLPTKIYGWDAEEHEPGTWAVDLPNQSWVKTGPNMSAFKKKSKQFGVIKGSCHGEIGKRFEV